MKKLTAMILALVLMIGLVAQVAEARGRHHRRRGGFGIGFQFGGGYHSRRYHGYGYYNPYYGRPYYRPYSYPRYYSYPRRSYPYYGGYGYYSPYCY